jgi:histidinol-phosphate aminotransferase
MARQAIIDHLTEGNRYPRAAQQTLKASIARANGLTPEHVLLAAGSASILQLAGLWVGLTKKDIISSDYTFAWLMRYAKALGSNYIEVPLTEQMYFDLEGIKTRVDSNTGLIYLCNPNNPTGTYLPATAVQSFCREVSQQAPIFVDEAYIEYLPEYEKYNTAALIPDHPNVMVCRTFSKIYGMAGLRVGYLLADPSVVQQLEAIEIGLGMTIANTSLMAANASLEDPAFIKSSIRKNLAAQQYIQSRFDLWNIDYHDANANFLHCDVSQYSDSLKAALDSANIQLNPINKYGKTFLRVSMGTMEEMKEFANRMDPFFTKNR